MTYTLMSWIGSLFDTRQSQRFTLKRTSGLLHMKKTKINNDLLINPCSLEWRWKMAYWNLPTIRNKLSVTRGIAKSGGRQLKYKGRLTCKIWHMPPDLICSLFAFKRIYRGIRATITWVLHISCRGQQLAQIQNIFPILMNNNNTELDLDFDLSNNDFSTISIPLLGAHAIILELTAHYKWIPMGLLDLSWIELN